MRGVESSRLRLDLVARLLIIFALPLSASHAAQSGAMPLVYGPTGSSNQIRLDQGSLRSERLCEGDECKDGPAALPLSRPSSRITGSRRARLAISTKLATDEVAATASISNNSSSNSVAATAAAEQPLSSQADSAPTPTMRAQETVMPLAPKRLQTWDITPTDKTLNATLARWASSAGWQLVWDLPVDYAIETRTSVTGSFEEAVGLVAKSMERAEIPLRAIFYEGNKVLRIVGKGSE